MSEKQLISAQFNDTYPPIMDGVSITVQNYAYWLNKKYGTCYVIGPEVRGYEDNQEFPILRYWSVPFPGLDPFRIGIPQIDLDFRKSLQTLDFDIIHAHCPFVSGQLGLKEARDQDIPIVATFHSKYKEDFKAKLSSEALVEAAVKRIVRFYESVDYVWVPAASTGAVLKEYGYGGEVEVWRNGTDMEIPSPDTYKLYYERGEQLLETSSEDFVFLFVGQHRWVKNISLIIESLKLLHDRGRRFKMVFVGKGPDKKEIEKLVYNYGLWDSVYFTGLIMEREEMKPLYARANVLFFPSLYDNAPLVMREAAAFRVPTILVEGTTAAENVRHGENGFLTANDAHSCAGLLNELMDNPHLIEQAGAGARDTIYISWEEVIDAVFKRYLEIIEEYRA
jgi:glycosyltransferase involved in cell wall biosynthesis